MSVPTIEVRQAARGDRGRTWRSTPTSRSAALPALEAAQRVHGWCSPEAIEQTAEVMGVTPAYLAAVATFYDMLETEPRRQAQRVRVHEHLLLAARRRRACTRRCCDAAGDDPEFNVRPFECLGACDIAPMASVDGVYVGPLTPEDVPQLLDDLRSGRPVLPDKQLSTARWPTRTQVARLPYPPSRGEAPHDRSAALQGHRRARA